MIALPITATLAERINEHHRLAFWKAGEALESARQAGLLLIEAKAAVKHGEWLSWLEGNVEFSARTAAGYMRLARRWDELRNSQSVADLGLRDALNLLAEPAGTKPTTRPETGVEWAAYTPAESALLERAMAAGGTETIEEHDALIRMQRRLMASAADTVASIALGDVRRFSAAELRHALSCCDDCLDMCEPYLRHPVDTDRDLFVILSAREIVGTLRPHIEVLRAALAEAAP